MAPKAIVSAVPPRPQAQRSYRFRRRRNLSVAPHNLCSTTGADVRSAEEFNEVQRLIAADMTDGAIYRKAATARLDEFVGPKAIAVPLNGVHYTA